MSLCRGVVFTFLALLSACAGPPSPYFTGHSAADVPSRIDVIKLDPVNTVSMWRGGDDLPVRRDYSPSSTTLEVANVAKTAAIAQFENFGIHVIEDDSRKPDMRVALYVGYVPETGILVHRTVFVGVYVLDPGGDPVLKEMDQAFNANGVLNAILESRDAMVTRVARGVVQTTFKELGKGTKSPASHPTS